MAGTSLLALIDDIATLLDDIAVQSKVAAQKTVGVLGDDLALNAEQVTGVTAERELPVIWAVTKGSLINKAILVPVAMLISLFIPWAIIPLLMLGGAYLCFEGAEKLIHTFGKKSLHDSAAQNQKHHALKNQITNMVEFEKKKIKGAIRTDFILSAEIIVICLGTLTGQSIAMQAIVLSFLAIALTLGVYGLVAALVKIDDFGLHLVNQPDASGLQKKMGQGFLSAAPKIMKFLSIAGTAAMFIVGGGILVHGVEPVHHIFTHWAETLHDATTMLAWLGALLPTITNAGTGLLTGFVLVAVITTAQKLFSVHKKTD